jgi:hypothetical protein
MVVNLKQKYNDTVDQVYLTSFATILAKQFIVPDFRDQIDKVSGVLMARQRRLGRNSPLYNLDDDILEIIIGFTGMLPDLTVQAAMEMLDVVLW